jgi:hypothetical protein
MDSKLLDVTPTPSCRRYVASVRNREARLQLGEVSRVCEVVLAGLKFASEREPDYFLNRRAREAAADFWWVCTACRGLDITCFFVERRARN